MISDRRHPEGSIATYNGQDWLNRMRPKFKELVINFQVYPDLDSSWSKIFVLEITRASNGALESF